MNNLNNIYNAGIIGCGWIAEDKHVPGLIANNDVQITALCDIKPEKAERLNNMFNIGAEVYSDYREMLKDEKLNIVHIAVPNPLHCELTIAALEAGKHVLIEKPMALTKAECEKMIGAAKKAARKLTVGYNWRYRPEALYIKELCDSGKLGDIYYGKAHGTRYRGIPTWGEYCTGKNGGGVLIDGTPHSLDLTLWAMNNYEPESVKAITMQKMADHQEGNIWAPWPKEDFKVEDTAFALVTMKNKAVVYIETAWAMNMLVPDMKTTLVGTIAGVDMFSAGGVRINGVEFGKPYINEPDFSVSGAPFAIKPIAPMYRESIEFIKSIRENSQPFVRPEEALVVTQIIEGIYISANTGKEYYF